MTAIFQRTSFHTVPVREQYRLCLRVANNFGAVGGHHVWPVQHVSYAAKPFRFALGTEDPIGEIQAFQCCICFWRNFTHCFQFERFTRQIAQRQMSVAELILISAQRLAVHPNRFQRQIFAVQCQGLIRLILIGAYAKHAGHLRGCGMQIDCEVNGIDPMRRCGIFFEENGAGVFSLHGGYQLSFSTTGKGRRLYLSLQKLRALVV